jgi:hypothetical protein
VVPLTLRPLLLLIGLVLPRLALSHAEGWSVCRWHKVPFTRVAMACPAEK